MFWPDPTHQPTYPPTHQTIHLPMGVEVSTDFKSSNGIEISQLVQVLLNFDWFRGCPPGGWGVGGCGWGVVRGCPHTCAHAHMHAHACACMYDIIGNSQGFPQWGRPFAWNYHVYHARMCMHAHACMHVHVCVGHPPTTPQPQSHREPKTPKFNKSWTNRDNSILFEDSLPLNIPELI